MVGLPGHCRIYDFMRRALYWSHMPNDANKSVSSCRICARNSTFPKLKIELQLFPSSSPLEIVAAGIIGPFLCTLSGIQYIVVTIDKWLKLPRAMSTGKTSLSKIAHVVFHFWVVPCGISGYVLKDDGVKTMSKLILTLCTLLCISHFSAITHHLQTNRDVPLCNRTIFIRLRHSPAPN